MSQYFLSPGWLIDDDGSVLTAVQVREGSRVQARGDLRKRFLASGPLTRGDHALGLMDPVLGTLIAARDASPLAPTKRSTVLRGTGWSRLFVELTGQCNEACSHCYADAGPKVTAELDWSTVEGIVEDGAALGFSTIQLTGGDPLLSPHVVPAAKLARNLGIPAIEIYTNGLALDQGLYGKLASSGVCFAFSMYSADPTRHDDTTRTPESHARTSRAIKLALAGGSNVRVGIVAMDTNAEAVDRTREYVASLGVQEDDIGIDRQREVGRGIFTPESLIRETGAHKGNGRGALRTQATRGAVLPGRTTLPGFGGTAAVSYDGKIHPCIFSRSCTLGDIRVTRLRAILEDPRSLPTVDTGRFPEAMDSLGRRLACWECRLRVALLAEA